MEKTRWKVTERLPNGNGGTFTEERFYDTYRYALEHVLQCAAVYNARGLYDVTPLRSNMRGDLSFRVRGVHDDFVGAISLERTTEG